jgi:hypothetical protein
MALQHADGDAAREAFGLDAVRESQVLVLVVAGSGKTAVDQHFGAITLARHVEARDDRVAVFLQALQIAHISSLRN